MTTPVRIRPAVDAVAAEWVAAAITVFGSRVGQLMPAGFEAVARVLHPAGDDASVSWADVAGSTGRFVHPAAQWDRISAGAPGAPVQEPTVGTLPEPTAAALADALARHTAAPDDCLFGLWEGFGGADYQGAPWFGTPARGWRLFTGPLAAAPVPVLSPRRQLDFAYRELPGLWWPADRAWFVLTEVDFDSTLVAGTRALVDDLLSDPRLEAFEVTDDTDLSHTGDEINPPR